MKKAALRSFTVFAALAFATAASAETLFFVGRDGDWLNPRNWSAGRVPGPSDDVMVRRGQHLVVNPPEGTTMRVTFKDIMVSSYSSVETRPGTIWITRNERVMGELIHRSTDAADGAGYDGTLHTLGSTSSGGSTLLNPTAKSKRVVDLQSSISFGIGGTEAASPGHVGSGYYANITAQTARVSGDLEVEFMYGFRPRAGDSFTILKADRIQGRFRNAREGAMVAQIGGIGIFIHYT
ncbi:hypothetical protein EON81_29630, partial [bacterium]